MLLWRNILSFLVEERDWLIRFKCLEGFEAFSKVTKHPDIVRQICSNESNPQIRDLVRSHLKRVHLESFLSFVCIIVRE